MSDYEKPAVTLDQPQKRRSAGSWFGGLSDRISRSFKDFDRAPRAEEPGWPEDPPDVWEPYEEPDTNGDQATAAWEPAGKRFPTTLHGYDRDAVDEHLAALEDELDQLRVRRSPSGMVESEIDRLGEETSAIIKVAHEQATEITRRAQIQADKCVADAAANAVAMTEGANRKLRQLDVETDAVWAERARLLDDARGVATALFTLVEEAVERFPEDKSVTQPAPRPPGVVPPPLTEAGSPPEAGLPPAVGSTPATGSPPAVGWQPPGMGSQPPANVPYAPRAEDVANTEAPGDPAG